MKSCNSATLHSFTLVTVQIRFLSLYTRKNISNLLFDLSYQLSVSVFSAVITNRPPCPRQCLLFIHTACTLRILTNEPVNDNTPVTRLIFEPDEIKYRGSVSIRDLYTFLHLLLTANDFPCRYH